MGGLRTIAIRLMQFSLLVALYFAWQRQEYLIILMAFVTFMLGLVPSYVSKRSNIVLPIGFEFFVILFLYAAIFWGDLYFYQAFWWWDIVLHGLSGIGVGLIGFTIIYYVYRLRRFAASPFLIALFTLSVALAFGAIWEIFEFAVDQNFNTDLQGSGLRDTMWDLIIDFGGAFIVATSAYIYVKNKEKGVPIFHELMREFIDKNPQFK